MQENLHEVCVGFVTVLHKTNEWRHRGRISSQEKSSCHPTHVYRNPSMRTGRARFWLIAFWLVRLGHNQSWPGKNCIARKTLSIFSTNPRNAVWNNNNEHRQLQETTWAWRYRCPGTLWSNHIHRDCLVPCELCDVSVTYQNFLNWNEKSGKCFGTEVWWESRIPGKANFFVQFPCLDSKWIAIS